VAARENRSAVDRLVEYLRARVAQGASPEGELIRAEVERDQTATDVTFAEVDLVRAQSDLQPFLGRTPATLGPVEPAIPPPSGDPAVLPPLDQFLQHAASRPELVGARAKAAVARAAVGEERSMRVREFGATFGLKRTAGVNSMIAGLNFSVPLFDQNRGAIDRSTAEQLAAQHELQWLERQVDSEIRGAYEIARRLSAQLADLQRSFLARAEESSRITLAAYLEGAGSLLQAIDAPRTLAAARLAYSRAHVAREESVLDLLIAAGYDPRQPGSGGVR
jgi:outer membrane protein TolC